MAKVSCSRTQHSQCGDSQTSNLTLYQLCHCSLFFSLGDPYSCIDVCLYSCLHSLSNEKWTKIHVQIRRFTSCLNMGLNMKIFKMSPALFAWHYIRKALRTSDHLPMFLFAKTLRTVMTLWRSYDVRKYIADTISFREIQCKKMDNLTF